MLNSVRVQRFKSLENVTLPLGERLTVLVGPNNAGKSSLLQAIQFAVSVVQSVGLDGKGRWSSSGVLSGTLASDQLVYTPLRDVQLLARGGALKQDAASAIAVSLGSPEGDAEISVSRGKNKNVAIQCRGKALGTRLQSMDQPFSVIAPGLAGIPSFEEFRSEGIVRRAAARGDANNVFRNVLWILRNDPAGWQAFQDRLVDIFPDVEVDVAFDPATDEHIRATITRDGNTLPIDASGTGVLQAAQVLAYVGVYSPQLLILDEPDAHLHPDNQRRLVRLLDRLAGEVGLQVLLSTHSRHMLDESVSAGAETHWVASGGISEAPFDIVQTLMDLGALDAGDRLRAGATEWVVLTEDADAEPLRTVLKASGFDDAAMSIWSYATSSQLASARALGRFIAEHAPGTKVLVHRDRDYLDDDDIADVIAQMESAGLQVFVPPGVDVESLYLSADHLAIVYSDRSRDEVESLLTDATEATAEDSKRRLINARVTRANQRRKDGEKQPDVGGISLAAAADYDSSPERYRHGKSVLKKVNSLAQERFGRQRNLITSSNALQVEALQSLRGTTGTGIGESEEPTS